MRSEWVSPSESGTTPLDAKNFLHRVFAPALKEAKITDLTLARPADTRSPAASS
jgi:hypothetical protein